METISFDPEKLYTVKCYIQQRNQLILTLRIESFSLVQMKLFPLQSYENFFSGSNEIVSIAKL
jgi:hypothetical protein